MRIGPTTIEENGRLSRTPLEFAGARHELYFRSDSLALVDSAEALLTACIVPAMLLNEDIELVPAREVCGTFLTNLGAVQAIFRSWKKSFKRAGLAGATPMRRPFDGSRRVASFFSGGIDSGYTLAMREPEIEELIWIHGIDVPMESEAWREASAKSVRATAAAFGKPLVGIETNYRAIFDPAAHIRWTFMGLMAAVALSLGSHYRKVYISASGAFKDLAPWGSDPILDWYFGSEALEFFHFGCEANRLDKLRLLAQDARLLAGLRTCARYGGEAGGRLNCGECEKCIRTMLELHLAGALNDAPTFPYTLDPRALAQIRILPSSGFFYDDMLKELASRSGDAPLAEALRTAMKNRRVGKKSKSLASWLGFR